MVADDEEISIAIAAENDLADTRETLQKIPYIFAGLALQLFEWRLTRCADDLGANPNGARTSVATVSKSLPSKLLVACSTLDRVR